MDFKKIFIKDACPTKIGGQAVLEGIMMKGEDRTAVVVRKPDGKLHLKTEILKKPGKLRKIPVMRGVFIFVDSLVTGTRTLLYSAEVLENSEGGEPVEKDKFTLWLESKFGEKGAMNVMLYSSVVIAILFTVGIFIIAPTAVVSVFKHIAINDVALNLIEGVFRIALFVLYLVLVSRMKDIQTVFRFHGAEHKCIHCHENGLPLTPENCEPFETLHPRCGTSFLMFVMVISLLLFSLLGWPNIFWRILSRLLLIPVIAGLSYELLRWAGRSDSLTVKILSVPGLLLQKLTTMEPDEKQLEVAIAAVKAVLVPPDTPVYEGECDKDGIPVPQEETTEAQAEEATEAQADGRPQPPASGAEEAADTESPQGLTVTSTFTEE
jgi:uncharacterized protein YqhQ